VIGVVGNARDIAPERAVEPMLYLAAHSCA